VAVDYENLSPCVGRWFRLGDWLRSSGQVLQFLTQRSALSANDHFSGLVDSKNFSRFTTKLNPVLNRFLNARGTSLLQKVIKFLWFHMRAPRCTWYTLLLKNGAADFCYN
jgi:hypothetical protein